MEPNKTTNQFNPNGNTPPSDMPAGDATASHINSSGAIFSPNPEAETANPSASLNANPNVGTNPTAPTNPAPTNPMSSNSISTNPTPVAIPDLNYDANLGSNPTILSPTMAQANLPPKRNKKKIIIICASIVLGISLVAVIIFMLWLNLLRPGINLSELKDTLIAKSDAIFGLENAMEFSYTQATVDSYSSLTENTAYENTQLIGSYLSDIEELTTTLNQYERVIDDLSASYDANEDFTQLKKVLNNRLPVYQAFSEFAVELVEAFANLPNAPLSDPLGDYLTNQEFVSNLSTIESLLANDDEYLQQLSINLCNTEALTPTCSDLLNQYESNNQRLSNDTTLISNLYVSIVGDIEFNDPALTPISSINRIINLGEEEQANAS